jgi:hypothetical protein
MPDVKKTLRSLVSRLGCAVFGHRVRRAVVIGSLDEPVTLVDACLDCEWAKTVATRPMTLDEVTSKREKRDG